jgi:hypothetical protein
MRPTAIAIDRTGQVAFSLNVTGMGRGLIGPDFRLLVHLTADER